MRSGPVVALSVLSRGWRRGDVRSSPDELKTQVPIHVPGRAAADDPDVLRLSALHLFSFIQDKKSIDVVHSRDRLPPWKCTISDRRQSAIPAR